jgi:predicted O-linked N-acetylglucosamine transferase (SPINDLY family)
MATPLEQLVSLLRRKAWSPEALAREAGIRKLLQSLEIPDLLRLSEPARMESGPGAVIALYRTWIDLCAARSQHTFIAWFNLGAEMSSVGERDAADLCWRNALAIKPDFYQAAVNLGLSLETRGDVAGALAAWNSALQPEEARTALLNHRGRLQEKTGLLDEAMATLYESLVTKPNQPDALQHWVLLRQKQCAWPVFSNAVPGLDAARIIESAGPISCLALVDDVVEQARLVSGWLSRRPENAPVPHLGPPGGYDHAKLRIGYLSSDYCMHPTSYLIAELIERHDRERFEVFGYCCSPEDGSDIRRRVLAAFDRVTTIGNMTDAEAAKRIRDDEIDILVDLNGATKGMRLGVLRAKPAPVQITYLGFVGPVPVPELDYMLCDDFTVPPAAAPHYEPKPLYIPGCYQANDSRLPVARFETRADVGLPDDKFVYCCFSNSFKVTESIFDAWMEILARTPDTVLWVLEDNRFVRPNMLRQAEKRGIAPERLFFAGRVGAETYLARLKLADLFLDTFPYNAGVTASDALRMGLPLVTLAGSAFAARMAGSLLKAVGLEQLITRDLAGYVETAVALPGDKAAYGAIRAHLDGGAWARTLGDAASFTDRLEAVFESVCLKPSHALARAEATAVKISAAA